MFTIRKSKIDQAQKGKSLVSERCSDEELCPVLALWFWIGPRTRCSPSFRRAGI